MLVETYHNMISLVRAEYETARTRQDLPKMRELNDRLRQLMIMETRKALDRIK